MANMRIILLSILILLCILNLMSQDTSIEVFVQDHYTEKPIESALVKVLSSGVVIDSAYTDINGIAIIQTVTSVSKPEGLPTSITLSHNYPNPFEEETTVEMGIPESQTITATVYNILGQRVASEQLAVNPGYYTLKLSLGNLSTGVYFLRIDGNELQALKLVKMGSVIHNAGSAFSISQISNRSGMEINKVSEDEYTLRVEKNPYDIYEESLSISETKEVTVQLSRNNLIEFIVLDGYVNNVTKPLEITAADFQTSITPPYTVTLKSGIYDVTSEVEEGIYLERKIEIPSVDTTIVLSYVIDIDNNIYQTIQIGDQWWMAENLRTTRYRNGENIPTNLDNEEWENTTSGAYAIYPHGGGETESDVEGINSDEEMVDAYGKLYNWYAVIDERGLCPEDWRVPRDDEWMVLINKLGGTSVAGGKLKSTRTAPLSHPRWSSPNTGATNESGFSALPGGERYPNGLFYTIGQVGYWWSSTDSSPSNAIRRALYWTGTEVWRNFPNKGGGLSVRCLWDPGDDTYETGTVTDIDGNVYQTIKIVDQWWMAENLKTTTYRNGDKISTNLDNEEWQNTTSGAYAIYPHDGGETEDDVEGINSDEEMVDAYGKLYNWYAVNDNRGLCPEGWHVPSDGEWTILANYLGGGSIAGGKLKSTSTEPDPHPRWNIPNAGARDQAGFAGLPGGYRYIDGTFSAIGIWGMSWSSTSTNSSNAWMRLKSHFDQHMTRYNLNRQSGFSVRCMKNQ